jgi:hypothetical protein
MHDPYQQSPNAEQRISLLKPALYVCAGLVIGVSATVAVGHLPRPHLSTADIADTSGATPQGVHYVFEGSFAKDAGGAQILFQKPSVISLIRYVDGKREIVVQHMSDVLPVDVLTGNVSMSTQLWERSDSVIIFEFSPIGEGGTDLYRYDVAAPKAQKLSGPGWTISNDSSVVAAPFSTSDKTFLNTLDFIDTRTGTVIATYKTPQPEGTIGLCEYGCSPFGEWIINSFVFDVMLRKNNVDHTGFSLASTYVFDTSSRVVRDPNAIESAQIKNAHFSWRN